MILAQKIVRHVGLKKRFGADFKSWEQIHENFPSNK
jgi:hypothetical protein